jgi:hypothetical protein
MSAMEMDKQLAEAAKSFFQNYTAQALTIPQINGNLLSLRSELDHATQTIKGIRENLALLTTSIKEATAQAKQSSDSAAKLARSLNIITACLVAVGILQIFVLVWHR